MIKFINGANVREEQMFVLNGAIKEWMSMLKATVEEVAPRMTR